MTSASPPVAPSWAGGPAVPPASHNVGFGHLLLAEWTKIRSVRSTLWSLILLVVVTLGFTVLFTWLTVYGWHQSDPTQRAQITADPAGTPPCSPVFLVHLT